MTSCDQSAANLLTVIITCYRAFRCLKVWREKLSTLTTKSELFFQSAIPGSAMFYAIKILRKILVVMQTHNALVDFIQVITVAFAIPDIMVQVCNQTAAIYAPTELIGTFGIRVSTVPISIMKPTNHQL
jgi:hypothetical protein